MTDQLFTIHSDGNRTLILTTENKCPVTGCSRKNIGLSRDAAPAVPRARMLLNSRPGLIGLPYALFASLLICPQAFGAISVQPERVPAVGIGGTIRFSANIPVRWSLAPGSRGSIDADGVYHAPVSIPVHQSFGGCQMLPNNHVFNTRVDTLPVHPKSEQWIAAAGANWLSYLGAFATNFLTTATPTQSRQFLYTPANNGTYHVPFLPELFMQSGWYSKPLADSDRHMINLDPATCDIEETYDLFAPGTDTTNRCATCNSVSGVKYSSASNTLPSFATDAAGMYLLPLSLHIQEVRNALAKGLSIQHALRFTVRAPAGIAEGSVWPATSTAYYAPGDRIRMGSRVRLKASFDIYRSTNPATRLLLQQLREYGLILADAGLQWQVATDSGVWPANVQSAFREISGIVHSSDLEVVDESSLKLNSRSGETPVEAETVIATSISNPAEHADVRVALTGITVGVHYDQETFQAGSNPVQLQGWVNGTQNKSVIWSLEAPLGYISTSGLYTPPAALTAMATTTARVASAADPSVSATVDITVLPAGIIRLAAGRTEAYTDTIGFAWLPGTGQDQGWNYPGSGNWAFPEGELYQSAWFNHHDILYRFHVPNGSYRLLFKFGGTLPANSAAQHVEIQGQLVHRDVDVTARAGGLRLPLDLSGTAVVSDGLLTASIRRVKGEYVSVSALEISPLPLDPATSLSVTPENAGELAARATRQFSAMAVNMSSDVIWSINPPLGSINAVTGLYTAPELLPAVATQVTIRATSLIDGSKSATAILTLPAAAAQQQQFTSVRVNCGGPAFRDAKGNLWSADFGYAGKSHIYGVWNAPIQGMTADFQALYTSSRYSSPGQSFAYQFSVPQGSYSVTLKFSEYRLPAIYTPYHFDVKINDSTALSNFDPFSGGSPNRVVDRMFTTTAPFGVIRIDFIGGPGADQGAAISGIEILPVLNNTKEPATAECVFRTSATSMAAAPAGKSASVAFTASAPGCNWRAMSSQSWLQVYPLTGAGNGALTVTSYPNYTGAERTAVISFPGQTIAVSQASLPGTVAERFVGNLYFGAFGRVPSAAEVAWHINSNATMAELVTRFLSAEEFVNGAKYVAGLYVGVLGRDAEYGGWLFQRNALALDPSIRVALVSNFLNSAEFSAKHPALDDGEFVRLLYQQALGRNPSDPEIRFQTTNMSSRVALAVAFLSSEEYRNRTGPRLTAFLLYAMLFQREPTSEELQHVSSQITSGIPLLQIVSSLTRGL